MESKFKQIQKRDVDAVFLNNNDFAEIVNIDGKQLKVVFSPVEFAEIMYSDSRLPQKDQRTFTCNKREFNIKGLGKIRLNGKAYTIDDVKENGEMYKVTIRSIQ